MGDELIALVALIAGGFVAVSTYRRVRHGKSRKRKFIDKAKIAGNCVIGQYESSTVLLGDVDSDNWRHRKSSLRVKYKYVVNGKSYYKKLTFQSLGRAGTDFPNEVEVYYDANNPKKAVCPEEAPSEERIQTGCLSAIAATGLTIFAVIHILRFLFG